MKEIKIGAAGCAALAALATGLSAAGMGTAAAAAGATLLICLGGLIWQIFRQARIDAFLLAENRRLQASSRWSDDDILRLDTLRRRSELFALQFQINPHFLYNTLDTIRAQALMEDREDIAGMAEKLARFFRYAISNREPLVRTEEEINHIQDYLYIQKKRFGTRFDTEITVEDPELYGYYMPKMLLQPLVENAITHGLERMRKDGLVRISIGATQRKLVICVEDNGVGIPPEKLEALNRHLRSGEMDGPAERRRGNGIAVQNVNARIRMIFGEEFGLHYRSAPGEGTQVTATLPLTDEFARSRLLLKAKTLDEREAGPAA